MTARTRLLFFFDFVDPLSYLVDSELRGLEAAGARRVERVGVELRPPPTPLAGGSDPFWAARWGEAPSLVPPALVPWSRKAHELHLLAAELGLADAVRHAIFEAFHAAARDIGRIDVLVEIAASVGLDRTETKTALDVDRWTDAVRAARRLAADLGVVELPALSLGARVVQGFQNLSDLGTLLRCAPSGAPLSSEP